MHRSYKENAELEVQCIIEKGRPVAEMEWYLGEINIVIYELESHLANKYVKYVEF